MAEFMKLDGKRITLANAEELVRARHARARIEGYTGNDRKRYYLVWEASYSSKRLGEGDTKPKAWKDAAENIAYLEERKRNAADAAKEPITDEQIRELRQASAVWMDENGSREGVSYDEYHGHAVAVRCCDVALGLRRSPRIGGKKAARVRCAEILNARANSMPLMPCGCPIDAHSDTVNVGLGPGTGATCGRGWPLNARAKEQKP